MGEAGHITGPAAEGGPGLTLLLVNESLPLLQGVCRGRVSSSYIEGSTKLTVYNLG